jgi:hypothetical protein
MDNKYDVTNLVVSAIEQKPLDFEAAFNDLIVDRIRTAVEDKKIEIAKQMYNYEPGESEEELDNAETEENEEEIPEEEIDGEESE